MDHTTVQWVHDVGCSTRSHRHPNDDVDVGSPFSVSPRHPHISTRDLTPDGSDSSCPLNEGDSSLVDEDGADSLESPGPDDLDEPWLYTFRVNCHPSIAGNEWTLIVVPDGRSCMDTNRGRKLVSGQSVGQ